MRVVVIGSGLSGLLVSATLARAGVDVVRLDRSADEARRGPVKVATVYANLTRLAVPSGMTFREMNGTTVAVLTVDSPDPRFAPILLLQVETNAHGDIVRLYSVMTPEKLAHLPRA